MKKLQVEGWIVVKLSDVCEKVQDGAHSSPQKTFDEKQANRYLYITSKNIRNDYVDLTNVTYVDEEFHQSIFPRCNPEFGDVLLTKDGANTGNVTLNTLTEPFSLLSSVCLIKTKKDLLLPSFLKYYIQSPEGFKNVTGQMAGAAIKRIVLHKIKSAQIPLPPLPEQQRIVSLLDETFVGLAQVHANAERNLVNAREVFEAEMEVVFTSKESTKWAERSLIEVCEKIQDGAHNSPKVTYPEKRKDTYMYITSKNIRNDYMDLSKVDYVDESFHQSIYPRCNVEFGDVLLTKDGANTGNVTLNTLHEPFSTLSSVCLIKTKRQVLMPAFLKYYIRSTVGFKNITGQMAGAAIKRIVLHKIKSSRVPIPPLEEQRAIVERLDALAAETSRLEAVYQSKLEAVEELKKSVLGKAFEGEL